MRLLRRNDLPAGGESSRISTDSGMVLPVAREGTSKRNAHSLLSKRTVARGGMAGSIKPMSGVAAKWVAIISLSALTIWFGALAREPVKGGPLSIIHLELAPSVQAADRFMRAWQSARDTWQRDLNVAQAWDTWFICAYAPLFALLCWVAAGHISATHSRLGAFGYALAGLQLAAGALDFLENAAIQKTIDAGHASAPWPLIGASASGMKWLLILAFLVYAIGAGAHWVVGAVSR